MIRKSTWAAVACSCVLWVVTGCAVSRGQESVGAYIDDAGITTVVKSRLLEDKDVAGTSISVETLKGTVMLSGFAKSALERNKAESIARGVKGVTSVKNEIAIRP
jgi:hyperosmotically inducible protein